MPVTTHIKHASRWCRRGSCKVILKRAVWYHLQCVQLVANWLTIFPALPRTMDRSNAKLGEGVKRIFSNLLAVFHVRKLSTQRKCVSNYCLQQHALFILEWILFCLVQTTAIVALQPVWVHATAFLFVFMSWTQKYNVAITCVCADCLCQCANAWVNICFRNTQTVLLDCIYCQSIDCANEEDTQCIYIMQDERRPHEILSYCDSLGDPWWKVWLAAGSLSGRWLTSGSMVGVAPFSSKY